MNEAQERIFDQLKEKIRHQLDGLPLEERRAVIAEVYRRFTGRDINEDIERDRRD